MTGRRRLVQRAPGGGAGPPGPESRPALLRDRRGAIEALRAGPISDLPESRVDTWPPEDVAAVLAWLRVHGK